MTLQQPGPDVHRPFEIISVPRAAFDAGQSFPPMATSRRDEVWGLLGGMMRGELPPGLLGQGERRVFWNGARFNVGRLVALLLAEPPVTASGTDLSEVAGDMISDMEVFGGAVAVLEDGVVRAHDPRLWWPLTDGSGLVAMPWTDAEDGSWSLGHNRLDVLVADAPDEPGAAFGEAWTASLEGDTIGPVIASDEPEAAIEVVRRRPAEGLWGSSRVREMWDLVIEIARRYTRNSVILDRYSGPIPVFRSSPLDAAARFGVRPGEDDAQRQRRILEGQLGMIREDTIHLPDNLLDISFLQPNVQGATYALTQVTDLREQVRELTGLPDLSGATLSGEALKRINLHFFVESRTMLNSIRRTLERLLGEPVNWEHPFDTDLFGEGLDDGGAGEAGAASP